MRWSFTAPLRWFLQTLAKHVERNRHNPALKPTRILRSAYLDR